MSQLDPGDIRNKKELPGSGQFGISDKKELSGFA